MSAHATTFHLSRKAPRSCLTLSIKYYSKEDIDRTLSFAQESVKQETHEPTAETPPDWNVRLCRACALLGIAIVGGDAEDTLVKHYKAVGEFNLPEGSEDLLGRTRNFVIKKGSRDEQLHELADLLLLHTLDWSKILVGHYAERAGGKRSLWALVESVEVTVPSEFELRVVDAPGFNKHSDPFRQSIALAAVSGRASAATLLMCFRMDRDFTGPLFESLRDNTSVLNDLLYADGLNSNFGFLASVSALDWELKERLEKNRGFVIQELAATLSDREKNNYKAMEAGLREALTECKQQKDELVNAAVKSSCQAHVVDVRGLFDWDREQVGGKLDPHTDPQICMRAFVERLEENVQTDKRRQHAQRLSDLLGSGLVPFYNLTRRIANMSNVQMPNPSMSDEDVDKLVSDCLPNLEALQQSANTAVDGPGSAFSPESIKGYIDNLQGVLESMVVGCTGDAVEKAWRDGKLCDGTPHLYKQGSRALGKDLQIAQNSVSELDIKTLLYFVVGPLARFGRDKLQNWLQNLKSELQKPIDKFTSVAAGASERGTRSQGDADSTTSVINQFKGKLELLEPQPKEALALLVPVLQYEIDQERAPLLKKFEESFNKELRKINSYRKETMCEEMKRRIPEILKQKKNEQRKDKMARMAKNIAVKICLQLKERLRNCIATLRKELKACFEAFVKRIHGASKDVVTGGVEHKRLKLVVASCNGNRKCAEIIRDLDEKVKSGEEVHAQQVVEKLLNKELKQHVRTDAPRQAKVQNDVATSASDASRTSAACTQRQEGNSSTGGRASAASDGQGEQSRGVKRSREQQGGSAEETKKGDTKEDPIELD